MIYTVFILFYFIDIECALVLKDDNGNRIKNGLFYFNKVICSVISFGFLIYEILQIKIDPAEYFKDIWNYLEVVGYLLYATSTFLDCLLVKPNDLIRIIWVLTVIFILIKLIYLVRVFKQFNFLVTMITNVVQEIGYFLVMFEMYLLTFAICFHIVDVDIASYGRMN